jgi:four helix bundle protein
MNNNQPKRKNPMKNSIIKDKSYSFALRIIKLACWLRKQKEYDLGSQVLKAGTAIGANVEEALAGISRAEFVAKMAIASKEARETCYWLRLLQDSRIVPAPRITPLHEGCLELVRILTAIVKTSQGR